MKRCRPATQADMSQARVFALTLFCLLAPLVAHAENYAECLLEGAKKSKTLPALSAVFGYCNERHPDQYRGVVVGSGYKSWMPFSQSPDQCTIKHAADVAFPQAAYVISRACCCLHGSTKNPCWGNNENRIWTVNSAGHATCQSNEIK